jgi:polar amino acid transport system substrate-binding protein
MTDSYQKGHITVGLKSRRERSLSPKDGAQSRAVTESPRPLEDSVSSLTQRAPKLALVAVVSLGLLTSACAKSKDKTSTTGSVTSSSAAGSSTDVSSTDSAASSPAESSSASGSSGAESSSAGDSSSAAVADPAALVPDAIKSDGKIVVGVDSTYAPNEFLDKDGKTIIGMDVDVFNAVAAKLGLTAQYVTAPFDAIIPGISSGKYEVGVSSFTINPKRKQAANMISYFQAGTQWATKKGNPSGISPDDACGKKVAVQKGTVQDTDDLAARSKKCTDAGKKAISVDRYDGQDEATAAVVSGKDLAVLADSPIVAYAVSKTDGKLELLGEIYDSAPYGYVVKKDQADFAQALADALKAVIADGSYKTALSKWGVEAGAITDPAVNP